MNDIQQSSRARVFLSYARADLSFTQRLSEALDIRGYTSDFDRSEKDARSVSSGIAADEEWWRRIQAMIAASDAMIFVVSPDSAKSPVCDKEIAYARSLSKRVIPVLFREVDFSRTPPRLSALNVKLNFLDDTKFDHALSGLCAALDVDVAWHREGVRLSAMADQWAADGKPDKLLLRLDAVRDAERWATNRPASAPEMGDLLRLFLLASEHKETQDLSKLRRLSGIAHLAPIRLAAADAAFDRGVALLASATLTADDPDFDLVPELATVGSSLFAQVRPTATIRCNGKIQAAQLSPDAKLVAYSLVNEGTIRLVEAATGEARAEVLGHSDTVFALAFSKLGHLASASEDGTVRVWDVELSQELICVPGHGSGIAKSSYLKFSRDGSRLTFFVGDGRFAATYAVATGRRVGHLPRKMHWTWHRIKERPRWEEHGAYFSSLSGDCQRVGLARCHPSEPATVYSLERGKVIGRVPLFRKHGSYMYGALDPTGSRFALAESRDILLWDVDRGKELSRIPDPWGSRDFVFSPDGRFLATRCEKREEKDHDWSYIVRLIDLAHDREWHLTGHTDTIRGISFDGTSRLILSFSDLDARLWSAETGAQLGRLACDGARLLSADFSADATKVTTASRDGAIRIWDVAAPGVARLDMFDAVVRALKSGIGRHPSHYQEELLAEAPRDLLEAFQQRWPERCARIRHQPRS